MKKPISRQAHGIADYGYALLVSALPELAGFTEEKKATTLCRALGGGALAYSLFTKAEWGVIRTIPFKAHLLLDFSANLFALGSPWLLGFSKNKRARNAVMAAALTGLLTSILTENEEMDEWKAPSK
ncbi:hypothetical protein KHS38_03815 [Mucilaginibacter sp. Bleaf8]|uniref:hypothetical protein n=1 Tax=Mucilaginibacter sp. Bleaf8 TaxID=2834430 RepID=UPI001BD0A3EC|nr:hypothetical protein [Mucilaginibacter sp. Bleaf8]MBS7563523.1 hypothetical protein [Mucilaginibacter sp. Bleaf8]